MAALNPTASDRLDDLEFHLNDIESLVHGLEAIVSQRHDVDLTIKHLVGILQEKVGDVTPLLALRNALPPQLT